MIYSEIKTDIREIDKKSSIVAHCIAADLGWGSGIAPLIIDGMYGAGLHCRYKCSNNPDGFDGSLERGQIFPVDTPEGTFVNLITKEHSWDKPTYTTLTKTLLAFRTWLDSKPEHAGKKIVMPRIGCGLDRLDWLVVSHIVMGIFSDTDYEIIIVYKDKFE